MQFSGVLPSAAIACARNTAVVVFAVPPFKLATATLTQTPRIY